MKSLSGVKVLRRVVNFRFDLRVGASIELSLLFKAFSASHNTVRVQTTISVFLAHECLRNVILCPLPVDQPITV